MKKLDYIIHDIRQLLWKYDELEMSLKNVLKLIDIQSSLAEKN